MIWSVLLVCHAKLVPPTWSSEGYHTRMQSLHGHLLLPFRPFGRGWTSKALAVAPDKRYAAHRHHRSSCVIVDNGRYPAKRTRTARAWICTET